MLTFHEELETIARRVQAIVADAALRPPLALPQLVEAALAYPSAGGKALRPALLTWACRALGGAEAPALRAGTAVELYHTYTLVHDDVIDRDPLRRGHPSVHALMSGVGTAHFGLDDAEAAHYGLSMAILAGDYQQAWAISLLASLPELGVAPALALRLVRRLQGEIGPAIVEGEARDIQLPFIPVPEVPDDDVIRVIRQKTSALFVYCAWAGGMLARGEEDDGVRALADFAESMGIAFQLQDDVLGLIGSEQQLGKPVGNDLREGKRTLIVSMGWGRANDAERALLSAALGNPGATPEQIAAATALLQRLGAVSDVQQLAANTLVHALGCLERLPDSPALGLLRDLAAFLMQRDK